MVQAYRDAGLRATILLGVADLPFAQSLPLNGDAGAAAVEEAPPPSLRSIMELAEAAVDRWDDPDGPIRIGLGPSAPQRCSPELLAASIDMARERGLPWQTHVLETKTQALTCRDWHGETFVELMRRQGILGPEATLVHTVWLSDSDIETMRGLRMHRRPLPALQPAPGRRLRAGARAPARGRAARAGHRRPRLR